MMTMMMMPASRVEIWNKKPRKYKKVDFNSRSFLHQNLLKKDFYIAWAHRASEHRVDLWAVKTTQKSRKENYKHRGNDSPLLSIFLVFFCLFFFDSSSCVSVFSVSNDDDNDDDVDDKTEKNYFSAVELRREHDDDNVERMWSGKKKRKEKV